MVVQGYIVFSVEHADGTASAAELAYGGGWLYYQGWGSEENRMAQTRLPMTPTCYSVKFMPPIKLESQMRCNTQQAARR